ncbi:MAG: hypothetical protein HC927_12215, partial [Deltaproteobacteria bacterium]|nr:hypothetical protein [Deltaproteobacteria bacterium]
MSFIDTPDLPGIRALLAFRPATAVPLGALANALLTAPSSLSAGERELIGAYCSKLNDCTYCYSSHSVAATYLGVDARVIEPLVEDIDSAPVDDKMKPVFHYVRKLTLTPHK